MVFCLCFWPDLKQEFEAQKNQWLAWDKWSGRTQGLFKLECEGNRMIALCSKCYFVDEAEGEQKKFSTKGMTKKQNEITWQCFKAAKIWQTTEVSGCGTGRWSLTRRRRWG